MLVVMQVQKLRARNGGKVAHRLEVGRALELERADEAADRAGLPPLLHQAQQPLRIAHDIREQPIDRLDRTRIERERALAQMLDAGQGGDARIARRLVDADDACAKLLQPPGPAARARAKIETESAGLRLHADAGEQVPELEIGAARRALVLDEARLAIWERARA